MNGTPSSRHLSRVSRRQQKVTDKTVIIKKKKVDAPPRVRVPPADEVTSARRAEMFRFFSSGEELYRFAVKKSKEAMTSALFANSLTKQDSDAAETLFLIRHVSV